MEYAEAVENAPPGWRHFDLDDIDRLPRAVRERELARVPPGEPPDRILRALFWTLVYHLEPESWDELARNEPIHPDLIAHLPENAATGVDVGAGCGRLTAFLIPRCREVVAVEPSAPMREILSRRHPQARAVDGWADALPVADRWSQLTAACGLLGPEQRNIDELMRVTAPGGTIALISPEHPEWFAARGWRRITAPPIPPLPHPGWIDEFFGPLDPPHEMVLIHVG